MQQKQGGILFEKEKITIRSSAAEYLIYVASIGDQQDSIEMRYEDENIWLTTEDDGKSERTIKRRTVEMQEKGLICRENSEPRKLFVFCQEKPNKLKVFAILKEKWICFSVSAE